MPAARVLRQGSIGAIAIGAVSIAVPLHAIDRIELAIGTLAAPAFSAAEVRADLVLSDQAPATATVHASRVLGGKEMGELRDLSIACRELTLEKPRFACSEALVKARASPIGALAFRAHAELRSDSGSLVFGASGLELAGGQASFDGEFRDDAWSVDARVNALQLPALRKHAGRWFDLPTGLPIEARLTGRVRASGGGSSAPLVHIDLSTGDLNFTNEDGTLVAEKVGARIEAAMRMRRGATRIEANVTSSAGQALAGVVLLDFAANPLRFDVEGSIREGAVELTEATLAMRDLIVASGTATLSTHPAIVARRAHIGVKELRFPGAYTSFMQLAVAATDFGALETVGTVSGEIEIADNDVVSLDATLEKLGLEDSRGKFSMQDVRGAVHWQRDTAANVASSHLEWSRGSAYGLSGAAARVDFRARGLDFELTRAARIPIFDGALLVRALSARELGKPEAELEFDAVIEPISMPLLSGAFGWPELSGRLSGSIPGLTYRDRVLSVQGDMQAQVFDGTITGSNFRLQDPTGPWPRLFADITARSLDLELVTRTFSIGSITGRLNADIKRLELFNWSPVAFEARLYSTPGDRSPHRISQKAVTAISSIGAGGGGGVAQALQSGVLRFFDEFNYDRIGITCRLRNEVCLMSGIDRGGVGYYIVKGRGIPRIDIVGSTGRVDWPRLVSQIVAGMKAENVQVR
jgi:hypothetical protein